MNIRAVWLILSAVALAPTLGQAANGEKLSAQPVALSIPRQPLSDALNEFARQAQLHVAFYSSESEGLTSPALVGTYTPQAALRELLANTPLTYNVIDSRTVAILSAKSTEPDSSDKTSSTQAGADGRSMVLAQLDAPATGTNESPAGEAAGTDKPAIEEIIVTAQKRSERLQDVPVPVSVLDGQALVDSNQLRLQDYYSKIPGLNLMQGLYGEPMVAIRGVVAAALTNPTVAILIDDVPYGSSTRGRGFAAPDIDPGDLDRIEVLRGPQGTLYGASSIGGLLNFVTVDPSTDALSGRVQTGISSVRNGDDLGYNVRGSVNVPLSDTFAVRASGFTRVDPGYIDNTISGKQGVNEGNASGGRVAALWRPSDAFSLKLSALVQDQERKGSAGVYLTSGDLKQASPPGIGYFKRKSQAYSAAVKAKLGPVDLTSLTGYNVDTFTDSIDQPGLASAATLFFGVGGAAIVDDLTTTKFSQEVRFSIPVGERLQWLVGGFYTDEQSSDWEQDVIAIRPTTGAYAGTIAFQKIPFSYKEYAVFTDLTFQVSDRFDVQLGGRRNHAKGTYEKVTTGPLVNNVPNINPLTVVKQDSFTYLLTPRFKISPDLMTYARFASGYRPGAPNSNCTLIAIPCEYGPDETRNYEVGIKGNALGNLLSFDASFYYIDWKDIQLTVTRSGFTYFANGGRAKSQGVELSMEAKPASGTKLAGWVVWNDAALTENIAATSPVGFSGDRLPFSARISGNLSIDQEFPLAGSTTGFAGASVSYVGDRVTAFGASRTRQAIPSYVQADLRAGLRKDSWTANVFLNNVADKRGELSRDLGNNNIVNYIQPRTVGVSLSKSF